MKHKNIAYIDRDALKDNYDRIVSLTEENAREAGRKAPRVICVVKADAYGHGIEAVADVLGSAGCDFFAVSSEEEADELRKIETRNGRHPDILILGRIDPENAVAMAEDDIICAAVSYVNAAELASALKKHNDETGEGLKLRIHVKLDTGMNRVGFGTDAGSLETTVGEICKLAGAPELSLCGMFTHFSSADDELMDGMIVGGYEDYGGYTGMQLSRFIKVSEMLDERGVDYGIRHTANSAALLEMPKTYFDAVRAGVVIYGLMPDGSVREGFRPVMRFDSTITHIHTVHKGERVSYGAVYEADREMLVATVAAGYADGFERAYGGCEVEIRGRKYRQIGRICMDQFMVDITPRDGEDNEIEVGDPVTLFGGDDGSSANALAEIAGTINYEVVCKVSKRVPRVITG